MIAICISREKKVQNEGVAFVVSLEKFLLRHCYLFTFFVPLGKKVQNFCLHIEGKLMEPREIKEVN